MGVSNQEIVSAAGYRNRSAIQYRFGSRDALLEAVRKARGTRIAAYRIQLIAQLPEPAERTTADLVEAYLLPLIAEVQSESPSYWARFCEMFLLDQPLMPDGGPIRDRSQDPPGPVASGRFELMGQHLAARMPAEEAVGRVSLTIRFPVSSVASWERDAAGDPNCVAPLLVFSIILSDLAVSMLDAPSTIPSEAHARLVDGRSPAAEQLLATPFPGSLCVGPERIRGSYYRPAAKGGDRASGQRERGSTEVPIRRWVDPFAQKFSTNASGAIITIGNTLLTCPANAANCAAARGGATRDNNEFAMVNLDVDGDGSTGNSSMSQLSLPAGASVLWAGLYWGANVEAATGADRSAGWALVVAYSAPGQPLRNLSVFDGFSAVGAGAPQTVAVSGGTCSGRLVCTIDRLRVGERVSLRISGRADAAARRHGHARRRRHRPVQRHVVGARRRRGRAGRPQRPAHAHAAAWHDAAAGHATAVTALEQEHRPHARAHPTASSATGCGSVTRVAATRAACASATGSRPACSARRPAARVRGRQACSTLRAQHAVLHLARAR